MQERGRRARNLRLMHRRRLTSACFAAVLHAAAHPVFTVVAVAALTGAAVTGDWEFLIVPVSLILLGAIGTRIGADPPPGRPLRPADEPELADVVRQVAQELGFRAPISIRVIPTVGAALGRTRFRSGHAFVLFLGWPLLRGCNATELRAIVAHELAHERHTVDPSSRLLAAREALVESLENLIHLPLLVVGPMLRRTQPLAFEREFAADRDAARVAGSGAIAAALRTTEVLEAAYDVLADEWLSALEPRQKRPLDLYAEMERAPWPIRKCLTLCSSWSLSANPPQQT